MTVICPLKGFKVADMHMNTKVVPLCGAALLRQCKNLMEQVVCILLKMGAFVESFTLMNSQECQHNQCGLTSTLLILRRLNVPTMLHKNRLHFWSELLLHPPIPVCSSLTSSAVVA